MFSETLIDGSADVIVAAKAITIESPIRESAVG